MSKLSRRGWLTTLFSRRRPAPIRRRRPYTRLAVEMCEDRCLPSSTILLNQVDPTTQLPRYPTWTPIGPAPQLNGSPPGGLPTSGRVSGIAVDPTNPNRIFVTAASGGVWRTTDGGQNWTPLTFHLPGIPDDQRTLNMAAIGIAPSNPNIIYAVEGEGDDGTIGFGVLKSTDGGNTWALLGNSVLAPLSGHSIAIDNLNPNIVYINAESRVVLDPRTNGIFRTLDGGVTWENITENSPLLTTATLFTDIELAPRATLAEPNILYCAVGNGTPVGGIYRSINANTPSAANVNWNLAIGGSTLVPGAGPGDIQITISKQLPSILFATIANNVQGLLGVYRTTDSGSNWQRIMAAPNFLGSQANYDNVIAVSPFDPNILIVAGQTQIFLFRDALAATPGAPIDISSITVGGITAGPHVDHHAGVYDSNGNFLSGNDGGIFRLNSPASAATANWVSLNGLNLSNPTISALNTIQFVSVALHPRDANLALGGSQDNGTARFNDNVGWTMTDGSDGGKVIYDYNDPRNAVHTTQFNATAVRFTRDGGLTWTQSTTQPPNATTANTLFYPPMIIDPSRSDRFYFGSDQIAISEDGGVTWGTAYRFPSGTTQNIPGDPSTGVPPAMGGPFPITAIGVPRAVGAAGIIFAAHRDGTLYRLIFTQNTAPAQADWFQMAPAGANGVGEIQEIVADPQNPNTLYVVGPGGVARSLNALAMAPTWTKLNGDLPSFFAPKTIQLDPRDFTDTADDVLYVGSSTLGGVYQLQNPGGTTFTWTHTGDDPSTPTVDEAVYNPATGKGLPDVRISQLVLNTTTGILGVGTYGTGMWEIQIRGLIRGQKFEDTNGNGAKDPGEPGVANVFVRLVNADTGIEIASTTTDAGGFFEFRSLTSSQLTALNYTLVELNPAGTVQTTTPLRFTGLTEQSTFDISDPNLNPGRVSIGNFRLGSISGVKFEDLDSDGVRDAGERGLPGFRIYVDANNNSQFNAGELNAITATDGSYTINGVLPDVVNGVTVGPNIIREVPPAGQTWMQTFPTSGFWSISLTSGQNRTAINFGNIRPSSISGGKFEDLNGNGVQDPGDPGAGGFTMQLINPANGSILQTTVTAADGSYIFRSLPPGTYRLREAPLAGWVQTTADPADITVGPNQQIANIAFGNFHTLTVSGIKFDDRNGNGTQDAGETGASGFTFELVNTTTNTVVATTTSDGVGNIQFTGVGPLPAGSQYRVREAPQAGWVQTTANPAAFTPVSGQNVTNLSFGNFNRVNISGTAYVDLNRNGARDPGEPGVPGFVIQLDENSDGTVDQTAVTAADGTYGLSAGPGTHIVTEQPRRGFTLVSPISGSYQVTVASGTSITGQDFGNIRRAITVTANDADGPPTVTVREASTNRPLSSFDAYDSRFFGGVRVAVGYVNGDQTPDIITAPGPGGGPHIKVFDGTTGDLLSQFFAYDPGFRGGVFVAAGDVNGDGIEDIITGAGASGGPHVKAFNGLTGQVIFSFFAYDPAFRGGVQVGAGDTNGDGVADIITGAGPGGGPHVKVFSGGNLATLASFFPYDAAFRGGVFVSAGDVNGDGRAEVICGPGAGGGSHVVALDLQTGTFIRSFIAFTPASLGIVSGTPPASGARVASYDVDLDGFDDFIVSTGRGNPPRVRILRGTDQSLITQFDASNPTFLGGIFVAGH